VDEIMDRNFVHLTVNETQEEALNIFRKYDRAALPVVDSNGVLVGIVTQDDMLDVAEEEATEDIQKIGGMEALDEPYMRISLWRMVRKRAGWLIILFLGEMLTATAMANYQAELAKALVLALFLPLIISSGGNSGSQASTLMIRAMALGEVTLRDWWQVMRREIQAGLLLGLILGIIGMMRVAAWALTDEHWFNRQPYGEHWPLVALTVGVALVGVVLWGTLSGSMLPFLLRRVGADPATSSAPFVATLVDVTGLIIYFSIALVIMRGAML
jgi:magnesium transporter